MDLLVQCSWFRPETKLSVRRTAAVTMEVNGSDCV